ncbi:MAG: Hpt domain-containing protein [Gammaproteobacteria bacterium]|nr:Hpt domain-containing protein [Gammaproteobacteria bacterium]
MKDDMEQQINELKEYYLNKLPDKIEAIETAWQEYLDESVIENLQVIYRQSHNMSGSAGLYGYKEIGDIAKKIDKQLRQLPSLNTENKDKVSALILQLRKAYQKLK